MIESEIPEINNEKEPQTKTPDDTAGFYVRGFLKIYQLYISLQNCNLEDQQPCLP